MARGAGRRARLVAMSDTIIQPDLDSPPVVELTEEDEEPDAAHIVTQKDLIESQISGKPIQRPVRQALGAQAQPRQLSDVSGVR